MAPGLDDFLNQHRLTRCVLLAALAQLVEHLTCNHEVSGSIPEDGSKTVVWQSVQPVVYAFLSGSFQSGQMGQTVNLLAQPSKVRILHSPLCT